MKSKDEAEGMVSLHFVGLSSTFTLQQFFPCSKVYLLIKSGSVSPELCSEKHTALAETGPDIRVKDSDPAKSDKCQSIYQKNYDQ